MTACIDPTGSGAQIVRTDPQVRLQDYAKALRFWLKYSDERITRILFVENSGYPLDELRRLVDENNPRRVQVEFISKRLNDIPPGCHYGWAELRMIHAAITESRFATQCSHLIKVTGRLTFPRLSQLLDQLPADFRVAVDARDNGWFVLSPQRFVSSQLMLFERMFYQEHLMRSYEELRPLGEGPYNIENLLFEKLMPLRGEPGVILRFPCNVDPRGQAAHWNKDYGSPRQRMISLVRGTVRWAAPGWWL